MGGSTVMVRNWLDESISATEVRKIWVWVGHVAGWLCALSACVYSVLYGSTFAGFVITLAACTVCQMFAVAAALWPGDGARSKGALDCHIRAALSGILFHYFAMVAAFPVLLVVLVTGHDIDKEALGPIAMGVPAHMAASIMNLIAVGLCVGRSERRARRDGMPDCPDWSDSGGGCGCGAD
ncbi:hypothetical protein [Streptomyces sp. NPDC059076]|uniref:hypothetical protein n=1 Tax=unclassified Streptomyces TaxID=2593676 RepID=UPI00368C9B00